MKPRLTSASATLHFKVVVTLHNFPEKHPRKTGPFLTLSSEGCTYPVCPYPLSYFSTLAVSLLSKPIFGPSCSWCPSCSMIAVTMARVLLGPSTGLSGPNRGPTKRCRRPNIGGRDVSPCLTRTRRQSSGRRSCHPSPCTARPLGTGRGDAYDPPRRP